MNSRLGEAGAVGDGGFPEESREERRKSASERKSRESAKSAKGLKEEKWITGAPGRQEGRQEGRTERPRARPERTPDLRKVRSRRSPGGTLDAGPQGRDRSRGADGRGGHGHRAHPSWPPAPPPSARHPPSAIRRPSGTDGRRGRAAGRAGVRKRAPPWPTGRAVRARSGGRTLRADPTGPADRRTGGPAGLAGLAGLAGRRVRAGGPQGPARQRGQLPSSSTCTSVG